MFHRRLICDIVMQHHVSEVQREPAATAAVAPFPPLV